MVSLFTTFYLVESNEERQKELLFCLQKNVQNTLIQNVYIFLDGKNEDFIKKYVNENITDTTKIKFIYIKRVPTYGDWIEYSKCFANTLGDVSIFTNADIYLDESIEGIKSYVEQKESIVCLSRHEVVSETENTPHPNPQWSQDLWAISKENILSITNTFFVDELNITPTGVYRCDNKLAYIFAMRGWAIYNPFPSIKCYHLQKDVSRSYGKLDINIIGGLCFPSPTNDSSTPSVLDISVMPVKVGNITKCAINKYLERNLFPEQHDVIKNVNTTKEKDKNLVDNINIAFFGASVTKQKEGYVTYFDTISKYNVKRHGYGAMHIKDAGICFVEDVIKDSPQYCFLDWYTPSIDNYKKEDLILYTETILYTLLTNNCIPIILFLNGDGSGHDFNKKIEIYNWLIIEICNKYRIPYIEVYKHKDIQSVELSHLLRDDVHTTNKGSELYSKIILEWFDLNVKSLDIKNIIIPLKTKFNDIKYLEINRELLQGTNIIFNGNAEVIGIFQDIGPFSCNVDVFVDDKPVQKRCLIDKHCYYTRECFNFAYTFENKLSLNVAHDKCDYSVCKKPKEYNITNWEGFYNKHPKCLKLKKVYYIGDMKIVNNRRYTNVTDNIPVVIICKNGIKNDAINITEQAVKQAIHFKNRVHLISDFSINVKSEYFTQHNIQDFYSNKYYCFNENYVHLNSLPQDLVLLWFNRHIILNNFMHKNNFQGVFHIDYDVLMYCNIQETTQRYTHFDFTLSRLHCPHNSFFTRDMHDMFVQLLTDTYSLKEEHFLFRDFSKFFDNMQKTNKSGGIDDMTLLKQFATRKECNDKFTCGEMTDIIDGTTFDYLIKHTEAYEATPDMSIKNIFFKDGLPYCYNTTLKKQIRFNSLHFQGKYKEIMNEYTTYDK